MTKQNGPEKMLFLGGIPKGRIQTHTHNI